MQDPLDDDAFFAGVNRLIDDDPRAALKALAAAHAAKRSTPRVLTARIHAYIALRETEGAWATYRTYLNACREAGGFDAEPPLDSLRLYFEEVNERAKAAEVREIAAMECSELLARVWGDDPMELAAVSSTLDDQLEAAPAADQAQVARTCALKACVLTKLGKTAEALKFWGRAKEAAPDVAEFWRSNSLLA